MTDDIWSQKLNRADMAWADSAHVAFCCRSRIRGAGEAATHVLLRSTRGTCPVLAKATAPELQPDRHHQTPYFCPVCWLLPVASCHLIPFICNHARCLHQVAQDYPAEDDAIYCTSHDLGVVVVTYCLLV